MVGVFGVKGGGGLYRAGFSTVTRNSFISSPYLSPFKAFSNFRKRNTQITLKDIYNTILLIMVINTNSKNVRM